jgi:nitroreductase
MEFIKVIDKRRTVRDFQDKTIPESIITYAIENAFKAPTYNHLRDWDFVIFQSIESKLKLIESEHLDKTINITELERVFENEDVFKKEMYLDAIPKQKKMILSAPTVVLVVFKPKTKVDKAKTIYDLNCLASIWTSIENFMLSLAENEVYGVTFIPQNINSIKEKFAIPVDLEIAAIIPIGYKADGAKVLKQKTIDISERMHFEKW